MKTHLLTSLLLFCYIAVFGKQEISITNITAKTLVVRQEKSLVLSFNMQLSQTLAGLQKSGDSTDIYFIEVWLKDTSGFISASKGFGNYTDKEGCFRINYSQSISYTSKNYSVLGEPLSYDERLLACETGNYS